MDLPENLSRVLSSTNQIENLFSRVRDTARRVKRGQSGTMILRWTAAGVCEAERHFRKVAGTIVHCPNSSPRCAHMAPQSIGNVELKTGKELS